MNDSRQEPFAEDPDFPSGDWVGYYQQGSDRSRMDLRLTFAAGRVRGTGGDNVGEFSIRGSYDPGTGEVTFHKFYDGAHDVYYRGFREGAARGIWGVWEIPPVERSGFHIWPRSEGEWDAAAEAATTEQPLLVGARLGR